MGNKDRATCPSTTLVRCTCLCGVRSVDTNSALYNFLGRKHIPVHFFDYHKHYTGSFSPREHLLAGQMLIKQTNAYRLRRKRLHLAGGLVEGATFNMLRNLKYYQARGRELGDQIGRIETLRRMIPEVADVAELMGVEGSCRQAYYEALPAHRSRVRLGGPPAATAEQRTQRLGQFR